MANVHHLPFTRSNRKKYYEHVTPLIVTFSTYVVFLSLVGSAKAFTYFRCGAGQFECSDGSCILGEKLCDGRPNCMDGSDERGCDFKNCEAPKWFQCPLPNGPCLSAELVCNGVENCPDGNDEQNCTGNTRGNTKSFSKTTLGDVGTGGWEMLRGNCSDFEYTCQTDRECIPLDFMCDGKIDCNDGSDELAGCLESETKCKGFVCKNKRCLKNTKWVCDGTDDCGDGSDELNCTNNCIIELGKFLCRNNSTCLNISTVCDSNRDCPDGSDESSRCTSTTDNCKTKTCPPASKCRMLPDSGPECICPSGYRYSTLQNACVDINECTESYGLCSQKCVNIAGGYKCTCDPNYTLRSDNRTCEAQGDDALLLYTTQVTVMGVNIASKRVHTVAKNLSKVIGVAFDGSHIFWTNIQNDGESIVKANIDGSNQQILLTSGLDAPEDLAVDWLTGNVYFSDNVMRHIAVCSNDGMYCTVLVTFDVHHPRGIALWPQRGQMFWTDWGMKPMIARASMDGNNSLPLVTENIHWPNGIALDMHNERVYWVDAKLAIIESIRPDGTDRRKVLDEILKHPYGLAIFEDNMYWSDWGTKSVHTCHKFSGKDHKVIIKDRTMYAVHIYHSAKQPKSPHPCESSRCSHLCLLAENNSFSCACPDGMVLSSDMVHCVKTHKKQRLFIGIRSSILAMEHTTFGRHTISQTHLLPIYVHEMAYNSINGTIIIADNMQRAIFEYDTITRHYTTLVRGNLGNITGLAFDHLSHNVYWTDSERHVVETFSLRTRYRAIVSFFSGIEAPIGIAVVPDDGCMFVALRSRRLVHIDKITLDGSEHTHAFEDELGDRSIKMIADYDLKTLYWSDSDLGRITFSDYRNLHPYTFRGRLKRPYAIAIVDEDLFWSEYRSTSIHWTHKSNMGTMKTIEIEVAKDAYSHSFPAQIPLLASTPAVIADHPCQKFNGGCSHICVTLGKFAKACLCPAGLVFRDSSNSTCIEIEDCEFRCRSGECLTASRRCNGRKDCPDNSDEDNCDTTNMKKPKVVCSVGQFMCHDSSQCIDNEKHCDGEKDCTDTSDEQHCDKFDVNKKCHRHQHACDNGNCVDFSVMCDGNDDCGDNSDESNCKTTHGKVADIQPICDKNMFQCNTGTCIAKSWECDGKLDCTDGSDEHEKCGIKECPSNMHTCLLGQCIDMRLVCDGHNDCGDSSDELNCDFSTNEQRNLTCNDGEYPKYQCPSDSRICLEPTARCNGSTECPRGEDEADCGHICSFYEFQCKTSKECIRMEFRCDHDKDCTDGSDEQNCDATFNGTVSVTSANERPCEPNMFDCKDGQCVDMSQVCDGFDNCDTAADEGPMCKTACTSTTKRPTCHHKCRPTPTGSICSCFSGYKLDADRRSCVDVNECEEMNPCAQLCENTIGSYRCSCYPDFMLRTDKITCKSIESKSALLFSTYNEVRSMSDQPIVLRVLWSTNDSKINGFDVNVRKRLAYFTTDVENILYMVHMDNGTIQSALMVENPFKVAVDWITDNIYVVSRSQRYEIKVCSFAAKMCGTIVNSNPREVIKALAVDALHRKLFFITIRAQAFGGTTSQVHMASLDGKKREILVSKMGGFISALTTDPYKKLLYYVDVHTKTLEVISYNLGSTRTPKILIQKTNLIIHPSGLSIYENEAFIVNIGSKEAIRCNLYGMRTCKAFNLNILNAEDVIVDGVSRQPNATNPCSMAKCSGICLQAEYGYECMCGNRIVEETVKCDKELSNEIDNSVLFSQSKDHAPDATASHISTITLFCLLFLTLTAAGLGYLYYRRKSLGHRDLNINLHFQNPLSTASGNKKSNIYSTTSSRATTDASFEVDREKLHFGMPIHRLWRSSSTNTGTEIMLEPAKLPEIHKLGANERQTQSVMAEDDANDDASGTDRHCYDDDVRARLVS